MVLLDDGSCGRAAVRTLVKASEVRMCNFKPQVLANMAWALAAVGQVDLPRFAALAMTSEQRVCNFKPQGLANTA